MNRRKLLKIGLGSGLVAVVAAASLTVAAPTLAQGITAVDPATIVTQHGGGPGGMKGGMKGGMQLTTVASALGITEAELRTELQAGKSVADVAASKNVSLDTIVSAVVAEQTKSLQQAVTDGRLTQAQADTLLSNLKLTLPSQLQTKMVAGLGRGFDGGRGGMKGGMQLTTVATALGITEAELRTELQAGKSVADVATAKNVSLDTVINAIVAAETTRMNQAVTDGKLTQTQADQRLADLKANLPTMLAQKGMFDGGRGPGRGPGRGTGPGQQQQQTPAATPAPGA